MRRRWIPSLASVAAALTLSLTAHADISNLVVRAELDTANIRVGDRIALTLTVQHDASDRVRFADFSNPPFIMVWDMSSATAPVNDQLNETKYTASFSSFVVGQHRVATNRIILLDQDGGETPIDFPAVLINVESVITNPPPPLADIRPAMPLPNDRWIRILIMIITVVLIGLLLALLIRRWMKQPRKPEQTVVIPPHDIALSALDALLKRGYIEDGNAEAFYVELSSIIRLYLEDRFALHAPEQTTEEFIRTSSTSQALTTEHRQLTQEFLEQSDLVKFARFQPSPDDMRTAWDAGARLVRETVPATNANGGPSA